MRRCAVGAHFVGAGLIEIVLGVIKCRRSEGDACLCEEICKSAKDTGEFNTHVAISGKACGAHLLGAGGCSRYCRIPCLCVNVEDALGASEGDAVGEYTCRLAMYSRRLQMLKAEAAHINRCFQIS